MTRILLVDDEPGILSVLAGYLETYQYDVIQISDSRDAVALIEADHTLDMMISDIRMTPINGLELLKLARRQRPDMPVILITGFGSQETFKQARELGAYACMTKPFGPDILLETIEKALSLKSKTGK